MITRPSGKAVIILIITRWYFLFFLSKEIVVVHSRFVSITYAETVETATEHSFYRPRGMRISYWGRVLDIFLVQSNGNKTEFSKLVEIEIITDLSVYYQ